MSDNLLPDEIISEILSPALKVSDEVFSNTNHISPFSKYSESTSAYLLVCKSWLRVATPLLYGVVILRSKAQAKALSVVLSKNKQLGQFIKKLRVEGGFGLPMQIVLQCSPNISDLFLSLEIYSSDNTSGLCKGLRLINPTRLILRDYKLKSRENKMLRQLLESLSEAISKWDRLCVFDCPFTESTCRAPHSMVIPPLQKARRLHTLTIPTVHHASWAYSKFKECPLKVIHVKQPLGPWHRPTPQKDPVITALLKFTEISNERATKVEEPASDLSPIALPLDPSFIPMAGTPKEIQEKVWARVLYFVMFVPELATPKKFSGELAPLLVSKTFNRLGLPFYYAHVVLWNTATPRSFISVLSSNPSLGPHVRSLVMDYQEYETPGVSDGEMRTILSQTSGLVRFEQTTSEFLRDRGISWDTFDVLANCSGSNLREFSSRVGAIEQAPATIFSKFTAMRAMEWKCGTNFLLTSIPEDGFQNLEELRISSASVSFLTLLSCMRLKSLRRAVLNVATDAFLKAHGLKLTELDIPYHEIQSSSTKIFELCPNLRSISLRSPDGAPAVEDLYSTQAVPSLVKITLNVGFWSRKDKAVIASWDTFFLNFEHKCLPNLHEININCCAWPKSEREITKSCWVRWAEMLHKRGIDLTDRAGKKW
ncbi:hypothetical protein K438DRAFT_2011212, partial [Mycena galopus ATCC 62051]